MKQTGSKTLTVDFTLKHGTSGTVGGCGIYDGIDSNGVYQDFTAAALLAWLRIHVQQNKVIRIIAEVSK